MPVVALVPVARGGKDGAAIFQTAEWDNRRRRRDGNRNEMGVSMRWGAEELELFKRCTRCEVRPQ